MDSILAQLAAYYSILFPYDSMESINEWLNGYRSLTFVMDSPERLAASTLLALVFHRTANIRPTFPLEPILFTGHVSSSELPLPLKKEDYEVCSAHMRSVGYLTDIFEDTHSDSRIRYTYRLDGAPNGTFRYIDREFDRDPVIHRRLYDAYVKLFSLFK